MRLVVWTVMIGLLASLPAMAALPTTVDEFTAGFDGLDDPENAAELFFTAVYVYTHKDKDLGEDLLNEIMGPDNWDKCMPILTTALDETPWVFDSYAADTDPDDGYAGIDPEDFELDIVRSDAIECDKLGVTGLATVFLQSTGCDSPLPLVLTKTDAGWKVGNASGLCMGPASADGNPGLDIAATAEIGNILHVFLEGAYLYILGLTDVGDWMMKATLGADAFPGDVDKLTAKAREMPWILFSYALGTSPDDGYVSFDPLAFRIEITRTQDMGAADRLKAYVVCSGADTARPYTCSVTKRGQYRMHEFSTIRVECRPPTEEEW